MADTLHITSLETSDLTLVTGDSHDHDKSSADHCENDGCHTGHFHHFLQTACNLEFSLNEFLLTFTEPLITFRHPFLDIVKPPLLIA